MHVLGGNSEGSSGYEITTTQFQQGDVPEPDHVSTITWAPGSIPFRRIPTPAVGGGAYTRALPRSVGDCQLRSDSDVSFPACPPYSLWGGVGVCIAGHCAVVVHTIAVVLLPQMCLQVCSEDDTKPQRHATAHRSGLAPAQKPPDAGHTHKHTCEHWGSALRRPAKRLQGLRYLDLGPQNFRPWIVASTRTAAGQSQNP